MNKEEIRAELVKMKDRWLRSDELLEEKDNEYNDLLEQLGLAEQLLRKAQRLVLYDQIQDYFDSQKN
tara:strand:- start:23 stop:223 length:201 start_codon:yes stop_codon:yes gene_type:complete